MVQYSVENYNDLGIYFVHTHTHNNTLRCKCVCMCFFLNSVFLYNFFLAENTTYLVYDGTIVAVITC